MHPAREPYTPRSNHVPLDREMANITVRGCNVRVVMHSASFFAIPTNYLERLGRRCLLSMSIIFTRTSKNNICDFSCKFEFGGSTSTTYGRTAPMVRGHHFLSLEKDTNFFADFEQRLKEGPCNLGEDWEKRGYAELFSILGDSKTKNYCAWGAGMGTSSFSAMAEGTLGKPAGQAETLALCILLDYRDAPPPSLNLSLSARIGVDQTRKPTMLTRFALGKRFTRYSNRELPPIEIPCGPIMPVLAEDRIGARPSRFPTLLGRGPRLTTPVAFPLVPGAEAGKPAPFDLPGEGSLFPELSRKGHAEDDPMRSDAASLKEGNDGSPPVSPARPSSLLEPMYEVEPLQDPPLFGLQDRAGHSNFARSPYQESEPFEPSSRPYDGRAPDGLSYVDPAKFLAEFFAKMSASDKAAYDRASNPVEHIMDQLTGRWGLDLLRYCGITWEHIRSIVEQNVARPRPQQRDPRWHDPEVIAPSSGAEGRPDEPIQHGHGGLDDKKGGDTSSVGSDETLVGDRGSARPESGNVNTEHTRPSRAVPPSEATASASHQEAHKISTGFRRRRALAWVAVWQHWLSEEDECLHFRIFHSTPIIGTVLLSQAFERVHGKKWLPQIPASEGFQWVDILHAMKEVYETGQYRTRQVRAANKEEMPMMRAESLMKEVLEELDGANKGNLKRAIFEEEPIEGLATFQKVAKELYSIKWQHEVPEPEGFKYSDVLKRLETGDLYRYGPKATIEALSATQRAFDLQDIPSPPETSMPDEANPDDLEGRPSTPASMLPAAHAQQIDATPSDQDAGSERTDPHSPAAEPVVGPAPNSPVKVDEPDRDIPQAREEGISQVPPSPAPAPGTSDSAHASEPWQAEPDPPSAWTDFVHHSPLEVPQEPDERLPGIDL